MLALALTLAVSILGPVVQTATDSPDARLASEFLQQVESYVALHRKMDATLSEVPEGGSPDQILQHQRSLEVLIRSVRRKAKAGDLFTRDVRAYFRRQIAKAITGPHGREIRDSIMEENPRNIRLAVNARYPDSIPYSTTPAPILLLLPTLPEELEYRFVGDRLVLLDIHAGTVVDYIDHALGG